MTQAHEPLVVFTPSGRRGRFTAGTNVLDAARTLGVDIDSVCGGRGLCGRCQVVQGVGTFAKHGITSAPEHLSPNRDATTEYGERHPFADGRRMACTAHLLGDTVIDVPPDSQVHRQVVRKELTARDLEIDPVLRLHLVEVAVADTAAPSGDLARLQAALEREWGLTGLTADLAMIQGLHAALEAGAQRVTVAIHAGAHITAVWPGFREAAYGVAVDVGSTTIAGHLADLADGRILASHGVMNPQIRFGEDLMSRVSYAMLHAGGAREMTKAVREAIRKLILTLTSSAGLRATDVLELVLVGNPVMHHLVLGIDPTPLGTAPFTLATDVPVDTTAAELELGAHPGARVHLLPCIAGHVGADTAGVILAEAPHRATRTTLIVDVGTNAELVLGDSSRLLAASSPTGPAFEGAQISSGQRAAPGAIERVRIDRVTLEPRIKVIGVTPWSDEPGFAAAVTDTGVTGICGSGIVEVIAELYLAGGITADGVVDGGATTRSPRIIPDGRTFSYLLHEGTPRIIVTQNDVRAIQLAKAALYAGAQLLMTHLGVDHVAEVRLAGAFGSQIDPLHALVLGLIPDCDPADVKAVGNAAGVGALMALLSVGARAEIERVARTVDKIETAVEPRFQDEFVGALGIPHRSAPFPRRAAVVARPPRRRDYGEGGGAGRPRRRRATAGMAAAAVTDQEEAR